MISESYEYYVHTSQVPRRGSQGGADSTTVVPHSHLGPTTTVYTYDRLALSGESVSELIPDTTCSLLCTQLLHVLSYIHM